MKPYSDLPTTKSFELYLIQAIAFDGSGKDTTVIYPPEFLFVLDVGFEGLIGVSVYWHSKGRGDPDFPDFSKVSLKSVTSRDSRAIIFPDIAGSVMIGVKQGVSDVEIRKGLEGAGLRNVEGSGGFWTAECHPFREGVICSDLENKLAYVKYAQPNRVVRLIDFVPGWSAVRLV